MRVNPNPMPDYLAALNVSREAEQEAIAEMSSGRRVNRPSDDPAASAILVDNHDRTTLTTRYLTSLGLLQSQWQTADSTLGSIETALTRALSLGVEGANGTLSDADRTAIVGELQGIQDQLLSLANTEFQGRYLFAGTNTSTVPFAKDAAQPSGIRYDGNSGVNTVEVGEGLQLAVNQPGSQLFTAAGKNMFQGMSDLIQAMQSNSGFDSAINSIRASFDYISAQRVFYGNTMNQAQAQSTYLNNAKLQLSQQENTLAGADVEAAASNLVNSENSINATLSAIGRFSRMNLFDFLK